jgi:hypothetical protein
MPTNVSAFLKLWTQSDQASERRLQKFLLMGLDKIVQEQSDVLSKLSVGPSASGPVVRWKEEWGYPTQISATLATVLPVKHKVHKMAVSFSA